MSKAIKWGEQAKGSKQDAYQQQCFKEQVCSKGVVIGKEIKMQVAKEIHSLAQYTEYCPSLHHHSHSSQILILNACNATFP